MEAELSERIAYVRKLVNSTYIAALATVNPDNSPHNSPVFIGFDRQLQTFWASNPKAHHSQNITRTGQVFIVVFDSTGSGGGGLYIEATARVLEADELDHGLAVFNTARQQLLREQVPATYFTTQSSQRLYRAIPHRLWVNLSRKDAAGYIVEDRCYEVSLSDIVA